MRVKRIALGDRMAVAAIVTGVVLTSAAVGRLARDRAEAVAFGDPASAGARVAWAAPSMQSTATVAAEADAVGSAPRKSPAAGPGAPGRPELLSIPRIRVTARVDPVSVDHGILSVPDDISRVGWWSSSKPPGGSTGSTVLDGHVDSARDGLGALADISRLRPGDIVSVFTDRGVRIDYRVYALADYVKAHGLPTELFASTGPSRLVLISCGGPFDRETHQYGDNVVVFATPV